MKLSRYFRMLVAGLALCSGLSANVLATTLNLQSGWNLVGNSVNAPLDVAATLGDATKVTTVWKWIPATSKWAFYTPALADGGAAYAAAKGYDFLTAINGGEGFWVNARTSFTAQLPAGTSVGISYFQDQIDPTQNKLLKDPLPHVKN